MQFAFVSVVGEEPEEIFYIVACDVFKVGKRKITDKFFAVIFAFLQKIEENF